MLNRREIQENKIKVIGGARVGLIRASFPLSSLTVDQSTLKIKILFFKSFVFEKEDVVSIEPFLFWGIRINHSVKEYDKLVIFTSFTKSKTLIDKIKQIGFLSSIGNKHTIKFKESININSLPINVFNVRYIIIVWSLFLIFGFISYIKTGNMYQMFKFTRIAVIFSAVLSFMFLIFKPFRSLILKEQSYFEKTRSTAFLILVVSIVLLVGYSLLISLKLF